MSELSHFDEHGASRMVDVGAKPITERMARATACVRMQPATLRLIRDRGLAKGDVLEVARLAGILAAKQTASLIPLCHPLALTSVALGLTLRPDANAVEVTATCKVDGKTGVEMEALTAVAVAALTVYDMCKAVDKAMQITDIRLVHKSGGKSGTYEAS